MSLNESISIQCRFYVMNKIAVREIRNVVCGQRSVEHSKAA